MTDFKMAKTLYVSFFFVALGVFVSVTVPSLYHIVAGIPLIIFSWRYLKVDKLALPKSSWALIIFVLISYLSSLVNFDELNNPMRSFGKQKYELFGIMTIMGLHYVNSYLNSHRWKKILNTMLFTIIAAGLFSAYTVLIEGERRASGFTEIMRYGYGTGFALSMLFACVPFLDGKVFNKKMFWSALVWGLMGLYFAKTRGAILGLFVSFPVIVWFFKRKLSYALCLVGGLMMVGVVFLMQTGGSNRLFSKIGADSNLKRLSQYEASAHAFIERPLLGHGVNQFSSVCPSIKEEYGISWTGYCEKYEFFNCSYPDEQSYCGHSHNVFLETATNRGVFALLAFVSFLLMWAYEMWKRQDAMTVVIFALLANFVVASQFEYTLNANNSFLFWFIYSISFIPLPKKYSLEIIKG